MKKIISYISKHYLTKALNRPCPNLIPRSGEDGKKINCFTISLDKEGEPHFFIESFDGENLKCKEWDGHRYSIPAEISFKKTSAKDFRISHYHGYYEIKHIGLYSFLLSNILPITYIKIYFETQWDSISQFFFNRKKFVTKQRMDLLKFLLEEALNGNGRFFIVTLMTKLYGIKWLDHPDKNAQREKVLLYLESLVHTGELKKIDYDYVLTGSAISTIEEYEKQEEKHKENVKVQRGMILLTMILIALTVIQTGLIKLPTLIDASETNLTIKIGSPEK